MIYPVQFIPWSRYTEENASETLNKKGYNHYKFSFMLLKNLSGLYQSYAKQNQNSKEAHITLSLHGLITAVVGCHWPGAEPHRFTETGQISHKEKTFQVAKLHPR